MPELLPYSLRFTPRDKYLHAVIEAERISQRTSTKYLEEIREECERVKLRHLMIVRWIPHVTDTIAKFNIARTAVDILSGIKTAWVNPYPENDEMLQFAMTVAINRGGVFALFGSEAPAESWLLGPYVTLPPASYLGDDARTSVKD